MHVQESGELARRSAVRGSRLDVPCSSELLRAPRGFVRVNRSVVCLFGILYVTMMVMIMGWRLPQALCNRHLAFVLPLAILPLSLVKAVARILAVALADRRGDLGEVAPVSSSLSFSLMDTDPRITHMLVPFHLLSFHVPSCALPFCCHFGM